MEAAEKAGHVDKVEIGTDVAASEYCNAETKMCDLDFKNPGQGAGADDMQTGAMDWFKDLIFKRRRAEVRHGP